MGPLIGGRSSLPKIWECAVTFLLVGFFLFLVSLLTFWGIEEEYEPLPKENKISWQLLMFIQQAILRPLFDQHDHSNDCSILFLRSASLCAALGQRDNLIFVSGMIVSAMSYSPVCFFRLDGKTPETESGITGFLY